MRIKEAEENFPGSLLNDAIFKFISALLIKDKTCRSISILS